MEQGGHEAQQAPNAANQNAGMTIIGFTDDQFQTFVNTLSTRGRSQRVRLREPDVFAGDRATYRTFKLQAQRFVAASPMADDDEKILAVLSCIRGPLVDGWVNSYTEAHFVDDEWDVTLEEFWTSLDGCYE